MGRRSLLFFTLAGSLMGADPVIGTVTVKPTFAPANAATQVTVTARITDPSLTQNGANVQRLNSAGTPTAVVGLLHDDGLNGDLVAGDHIYTLVFTLNEPAAGRIYFRATGAFQGVVQRVPSSIIAVDIANAASPLAIDATTAPAPNAAGWNRQDVTVSFSCAGGAGGSDSCPGTVRVTTEGSAQAIPGTATDGSGNNATKTAIVNLDKTGPILNIASPANGAVVATPTLTLTGTVTDPLSGVASFACNGQTASINGSNFSCNLSLVPGSNAITVQATDVAGNTSTSNLNVTFSITTLTISGSATPLPNAAGWNNTDVTVAFACAGGAIPVSCPPSVVISNESGNQVISRTATDALGSTATASVTLKIDKTRPTLTITSPAAAATVTTPQLTVNGTATDTLSGLARVTCNNAAATVNGSSFSCNLTLASGLNAIVVQATDVAGNIATSNLSVTLGTTLTISATPNPPPNGAGWNNSNVTVTFACAGGAGTVICPPPVVVSSEGVNQVISRTASDTGGNSATASVTLKIDKTPPVLAISSPASGAIVANPQLVIAGILSDALSGVASATCSGSPATLTQGGLSCSRTLVAGLNTIVVQAIDIAGNSTALTLPVTLNTPALTISATQNPVPNAAGWNNSNVTVTFACAGGTGNLSCPQPVVVSTEGANQTISRTVADNSGNSATTSVTLRIDKTPPTLSVSSPASGATVTTPQITVTGTATDALSGIATVTCNGAPATLVQANFSCNVALAAGSNSIAVRATDIAGNVLNTSVSVTYSAQGLTITSSIAPTPNAAGWNNSNATVTFICSGGVGAITCPQPVVVSTEGASQVISRTATDTGGNSATTSVTLKIDKTAPVLMIGAPPSGTTVNSAQVTVTGTASDTLSGVANVTCNGSTATLTNSNFTCAVTLALGPNTVTVTATDIAGNVSTSTLPLTFLSPLTISFSAPANLSYLSLSPTTVSGTVSDSSAVVTINSIATPVSNGQFSVQIPLAEGPNILTATATASGGAVSTASIQVTLDTTPPHVTITTPPDKFVTTDTSITVAGTVNDIVVGTVNDQQASVTVNGGAAQVANRSFLLPTVALSLGDNIIQAVARDRAGNAATTQVTVTRQAPTLSQIRLISGNNQTGTIGGPLPSPLVVALTDDNGSALANKPVIFKVTQNNGSIAAGGQPAPGVIANTNAQGQAQVQWTLGLRAGAGANTVEAYSVGIGGTAIFSATGNQGPAGKIVVDSGDAQFSAVGQPLPKPLIAVVIDDGNNRLSGVPVTFTVKQGGGSFSGQPTFTVNTDSDGRAAATLTLGFQEGNANNLIEANFRSNQGFPASFTASGRAPGDPTRTTISGVVLDNSNLPIPGVTIRAVLTNLLNSNSTSINSVAAVPTDAHGQFVIPQAPVGFVKLLVDGSTAQRPGTYPTLDYDVVTVAGQNNTVGMPIYLLALSDVNQLCVTATTGGGTLTIPEAPGFSLTFGPGQVTFPGGSKTGCVGVTVVHGDKVPMVPGFGQQPRFIVTIQPAGAVFNPPAPITLPNVDGIKPRAVTEMYSFDHDVGSFVAIGTGTVSDDGLVIRSNRGVGVLKAGWHCGGDPNVNGTVADCGACHICVNNRCVIDDTQVPLGPPQACTTLACSNGTVTNVPAQTDAQCCATVSFTGGFVVCCNANKLACAGSSFNGPGIGSLILKQCVIAHETQHFGDVDCPNGVDQCATTRPPFRTGVNQGQAECVASRVEVACLRNSNCGFDAACQDQVDNRIVQIRAYGNENAAGCFP